MTLTATYDGEHGYGCGIGEAFCSATLYYYDYQGIKRLWSYCGDGAHAGTCTITSGALVSSGHPLSDGGSATFQACDGIDVACATVTVVFAPFPVNLQLTGVSDGNGSVRALLTNPPNGFGGDFPGFRLYDDTHGVEVSTSRFGYVEQGPSWSLAGCAGPWFHATYEWGDEIRQTGVVHIGGITSNGAACPDLPVGSGPGGGTGGGGTGGGDTGGGGTGGGDTGGAPSLTVRDLALRFEPVLRFDTSEDMRPLNVDRFLAEGNHTVCRGSANTCTPVRRAADLTAVTAPNAYLNVFGKANALGGSRPQSPNAACRTNGLRDCDTGDATAMYYGLAKSGSAYTFLDYWAFYRDNYFAPGGKFYHEGDWERITVAPTPDGSNFDFVGMSQHEHVWAYLRGVLRCQGGPSSGVPAVGNCTGLGGQHIATMVARGSHANYSTPCSARLITSCRQNAVGATIPIIGTKIRVPENGYDGTREWGAAFTPNNLLPLPLSGNGDWTDWVGHWGPAGNTGDKGLFWSDGPQSPGSQAYDLKCAEIDNGNGKCSPIPAHSNTEGLGSSGEGNVGGNSPTATAQRASVSDGAGAERVAEFSQCGRWIGPGVGAAVCSPKELARGVRNGTVGHTTLNSPTLTTGNKTVIRGAGIAQALSSAPLTSGTPIRLSGPLGASSRVLVRYRRPGTKTVKVASFDLGKLRGSKLAQRYGRGVEVALVLHVGSDARLGPIREG